MPPPSWRPDSRKTCHELRPHATAAAVATPFASAATAVAATADFTHANLASSGRLAGWRSTGRGRKPFSAGASGRGYPTLLAALSAAAPLPPPTTATDSPATATGTAILATAALTATIPPIASVPAIASTLATTYTNASLAITTFAIASL